MGRHAARITHSEVVRLIKAVISSGLTVQRVTFDGERVDVVVGREPIATKAARDPSTFETLEDYRAWRALQPDD
jgi:hypothetical protein